MKKSKDKKRFNIFNFFGKDGKGVEKGEENLPLNFKNFFKLFGRKFGKLLSLNVLMVGKIPMYLLVLLILSALLSGLGGIFEVVYGTTISLLGNPLPVSSSPLFGTVSGLYIASSTVGADGTLVSASTVAPLFLNIGSTVTELPTLSAKMVIVFVVLFLFSVITWGWQNVGATYVTRGLVRGDPVFVFSDYFHGIKKNLKQGFFLGLIDAFVILLLAFDFGFMYTASGSVASEIVFYSVGGLIILYYFVRKYIYLLSITFDIKLLKLFKNSLIFTVLGIKRNLLGALGAVVLLGVNVTLGVLCMNVNFIIPLMLPLVYFFATSLYISTYSVYPVIDKYMIAPYKKAHPAPEPPEDDDGDDGDGGEPEEAIG